MSCYLRFGKELLEFHQQQQQLLALFCGARVGRLAVGIQPAFVAYSYAAAVVRTTVGAGFKQPPVLCHHAAAADIEVVANGTEAARLVVF